MPKSKIKSLTADLETMLAEVRASDLLDEWVHADKLMSEKVAQTKPATSNNQKLSNVTK